MPITRRRFIQTGTAAAAGLSLWGCGNGQVPAGSNAPASATTVFRNGIVLPVDAGFSQHAALAIRDGRILAVGDNDAVAETAGRGANVVDLDGRVVLPGFIEPHMHFLLMAGLGHLRDIGPFNYPTFEETLAALREIRVEALAAGPDEWVMGRQFDPILLEPQRELLAADLDEVVPDRPVFVLNASGHIAYVNSIALQLAGITADTPDPDGAEFGRNPDGSPNGVLYGTAAHLPVMMVNPGIASRMQTQFVTAGREVGDQAAALGITTLCDMATGAAAGASELTSYRAMYDDNGMKARIRAYLYSEAGGWDEAGVNPGDGDALMRVAGWKIVTDGSNQGFTGRQREPYYTQDTVGLYYVQPADLRQAVIDRADRGWQLAMHGNGDAAIDSILDAMEAADAEGVDVRSLRCRIEHCSILHDEQIERMRSLDMVPSFLINHVHYWGHVMRDAVFGPEKVQLLDRCASVEQAGLTWVNHTDAPVSHLGSLHKIRVAVARDLWKEPGTILAPDERVGVETAPGKFADLVILEEDPRAVEPTQISDIVVSETWMNGDRVFGG